MELGEIAYIAFQEAQGEDGDMDTWSELDPASAEVESWQCAAEAVANAVVNPAPLQGQNIVDGMTGFQKG